MINLILLDMYGTIVGGGNNTSQRNGLHDFVFRHSDKKLVIVTDDPDYEAINSNVHAVGLATYVDRVYGDREMIFSGDDKRKDLLRICREYAVAPTRVVFIGDSDRDKDAAKIARIPFVHVPYYESSEESFSFDMIDISKSRFPLYQDLRSVND